MARNQNDLLYNVGNLKVLLERLRANGYFGDKKPNQLTPTDVGSALERLYKSRRVARADIASGIDAGPFESMRSPVVEYGEGKAVLSEREVTDLSNALRDDDAVVSYFGNQTPEVGIANKVRSSPNPPKENVAAALELSKFATQLKSAPAVQTQEREKQVEAALTEAPPEKPAGAAQVQEKPPGVKPATPVIAQAQQVAGRSSPYSLDALKEKFGKSAVYDIPQGLEKDYELIGNIRGKKVYMPALGTDTTDSVYGKPSQVVEPPLAERPQTAEEARAAYQKKFGEIYDRQAKEKADAEYESRSRNPYTKEYAAKWRAAENEIANRRSNAFLKSEADKDAARQARIAASQAESDARVAASFKEKTGVSLADHMRQMAGLSNEGRAEVFSRMPSEYLTPSETAVRDEYSKGGKQNENAVPKAISKPTSRVFKSIAFRR